MNLGELRKLFVERSGRSDLVNSDDSDNGANFFIQSGQRTLDRMLEIDKSWARSFKTLVSGDYYAMFKGCRAIKGVWISTSDGRTKLEKISIEDMRELYGDGPDEVDSGTTLYYSIISLRTFPNDDNVIVDYLQGNKIAATEVSDFEYTGIIFLPPPSGDAQLEVFGLIKSTSLESDSDENYWTMENPDILLIATLYRLEVDYRNTEGANDWMRALQFEVGNLEKDWVESDIAGVTQISG